MIPDLLNLLTPEERAAWALCEGATPGPWVDMTSAGPDVGAFDGEIRAALSFAHICSDVPGDDRKNDRAFIAGSRDALPAALTTIATLRAEHVAYRANADDLFQEMRVRGEALQRDLRDAESAASVEASEADRLRAELRAVADLLQEVGVLGIASTMDAVVVSGQPSARDLLTWAAKAMDAWPEERQTLRAELNGILDDARVLAAAVGVPADSDAPMTEALRRVEAQRDALAMAEEREREMVIARDILRETLAEQQRAFVIGLDLAQRTADAEIAELRATLANDRGEGEPPSEGWKRNTTGDGMWERILAMRPSWTSEQEGEPTDTLIVGRDDDVHWRWERYVDNGAGQRLVGGVGGIECARTAMKAADDAVRGAT